MEHFKLLVNSKITGLCQGNKTNFSQALNQTLQTTEMKSENTVRLYKLSFQNERILYRLTIS